MKRYLFTLLLVTAAAGCNRNAKPTEMAGNDHDRDDSHLYGSHDNTTGTADETAHDMSAPQHRTSDEIATTGDVPDRTRPANAASEPIVRDPGDNPPVAGAAPDNTAVNERDRGDATLTPMDQSENESDIKLTQDIRRAIVEKEGLSFSSKNVKVISRNGKVTLRGTVPNARERTLIEDAAKSRAGVAAVDNQLEVETK